MEYNSDYETATNEEKIGALMRTDEWKNPLCRGHKVAMEMFLEFHGIDPKTQKPMR